MNLPTPGDYPEYYQRYFKYIKSELGTKQLEEQCIDLQQMVSLIPFDKEDFVYAPGKWTVREILGHLNDSERIFGYRALCIARNEQQKLPGWDENEYVVSGGFNKRTYYDLLHEFSIIRESNISLFKSLSPNDLIKTGIANNQKISVQALFCALFGHVSHHLEIIRTRYITQFDSVNT